MSDLPELQLTVFLYGSEERRVEIEMRPKVPSEVVVQRDPKKIWEWAQGIIFGFATDVKHSEWWECEFCGKPARETMYNVASWAHLDPPRMVVYIHHMCDYDNPRCHAMFTAVSREMGRITGCPPQVPPRLPKPPGQSFPLAGSCVMCKESSTAAPRNRSKLSRCSRCKLTRYCSVDCQKADWSRHKKVCKTITQVKWVWK